MPNQYSPARYPHLVPFFDPDTFKLQAVPYSTLGPRSEYQILTLPRLPGYFDVYVPYDPEEEPDYAIVTQFSDDVRGKYWVRRCYHKLLPGWRAGIIPMILRRRRQLWVGAMPPAVALEGLT